MRFTGIIAGSPTPASQLLSDFRRMEMVGRYNNRREEREVELLPFSADLLLY
jgi:hypothetical protein